MSRSPGDPRVLRLLGATLASCGELEAGLSHLRESLRLEPRAAGTHAALGAALFSAGRKTEAVACFERAVALDPVDSELRFQLAGLLEAAGEPLRAMAEYGRVLENRPGHHQACNRLGFILQSSGRVGDALKAYCEALRLNPSSSEYCFNAGSACQHLSDWEQAAGFFRRALELEPANPRALNHLGACLFSLGRLEESVEAFGRSLALRPDSAETLTNLGEALRRLNRLEESADAQRRALELDPGDPNALANLGNTRLSQNRVEEALACYEKALELKPDSAGLRYNAGLARLAQGDWEKGWELFEARLEKDRRWREFRPRFWTGRAPARSGERMLLLAEQGLGDTLQFVRYAREVSELGFEVSILAHAALRGLFAVQPFLRSFYVEGEELPRFDLYCPLLSLPRLLWKRRSRVPAEVPYLAVPGDRTETAVELLDLLPAPRVGLVWSGHPGQSNNRNRSLPLDQLASALPAKGLSFFALQKLLRPEDRASLARHPEVTDLSGSLNDFADTAAIVSRLDLVVTVDTSVAHLAGALGAPALVLLCFAPDWRWRLGREDSPWYPSLRLVRQPAPGDWGPVLAEVSRTLAALAAGSGTKGPTART